MDGTDPRLELVNRFFSGTGSTYDFMVNFATLGIDRRWKRQIVDLVPLTAERVLDLACGTGILTFAIADAFPDGQVVGVELRDEYLRIARDKARRRGVRNVEFVLSRAEDYRPDEPFDCVVSSYLAKYADLPRLVGNIRESLTDGGLVLMHDFTYPPKAGLVRIWRLYFTILQTVGGRIFPEWREIYHGLPRLIEQTRWTDELQDALRENGFTDIRMWYLTAYGSAIVSAYK